MEKEITIEFVKDGSIANGAAIINGGETYMGDFAYCAVAKLVYTCERRGGWRIHAETEADAKRVIASEIREERERFAANHFA